MLTFLDIGHVHCHTAKVRTWRALIFVALFGTTSVGAPPAQSQSATPGSESFMLPAPSGRGQPSPSPIHATSWSVRRITDSGPKVVVPNDAVVFFDWGVGLSESLAFVYDGCTVTRSTFRWTNSELFVAAPTYEPPGCGSSRQKTFRASFTGTFVHRIPKTIAPGTAITLVAGKRRIELIRRAESQLNQTAWATVDSIPHSTLGRIDGNLSFGTTTFRGNDGCNSIEGIYLEAGRRIRALTTVQTMAACNWRSFGWSGGEAQVTMTSGTLTMTSGSTVHRYRKVAAVAFSGPPMGPPDPNATAAFTTAAVLGSWMIETLAGGKTGPGVVGTLEFRSDGSFLGETPCETLSGTWTQAAISMATTIRTLTRELKPCDDALKPDALALGDMLANKELAIGRGDIRLTLWKAGSGGTNLGIQLRAP